jgi:glycosyltransferase involved in cell wall biosynthesis
VSAVTVESERGRQPIVYVGIDATSWSNERGFGRFTRGLVTALAARESEFRYTLLFDQAPGVGVPARSTILSARTRRALGESTAGESSRSLSHLWAMSRLARVGGFDLFFFPTSYSYFPLSTRVPCVVCFHDATAERMPRLLFPTRLNQALWRLKTKLAARQATRAMTVSQSSAADVERFLHFPPQRIDVVTEAADPAFRRIADPAVAAAARTRHGIPSGATLLVHLGGLNRHKNVLTLLKAMPTIIEQEQSVHLAIVGDATGRGFWDNVAELKRFAGAHPLLAGRVHFTGYLDDTALAELLNGAYALVFPSLWEGFGLPAVEAMSCGVPVLASRRGSLPEVVGEAGLFFEPDDPSEIAACVLALVRDPERRAELAAIALAKAGDYSWERAAELAEASFRRSMADGARR